MLEILRRIVQEVSHASGVDEALAIVVREVCDAMNVQACTIFLLDNRTQEYVMMATKGLSLDAVKKVRLPSNEGLIGLIGSREEPINLENAHVHPRFVYDPRVGEDKYHALLGVPIIHQRSLLGVMVVQEESVLRFESDEEAFLITLSAQLAGVIAHAIAVGFNTNSIDDGYIDHSDETATFAGIPCVPGIGIGQGVTVFPRADLFAVPFRKTDDIDTEIIAFETALAATREDIKRLRQKLIELPPEEKALFEAYLSILDRASLGVEVIEVIKAGMWAQGALRKVIEEHLIHFESMQDEYLRERATDIKDLAHRVLAHLQQQSLKLIDYPERTILIGQEVSAADLADVPEGGIAGVVSGNGSINSHVAILARALGVPTIMGAGTLNLSEYEGKQVIVDGYYGHIYVEPSLELFEEFIILAAEEQELETNLATLRNMPSVTPDGHRIDLYVNTGLLADSSIIFSVGASGVGLFRTEISFMNRENFPAENEQRAIYHQLLQAFSPRPVVMRTLDIGGDKALSYFPIEESNPFLGWRGIRITLDHPEVFLVQVRAMLRASVGLNNLRIMLPMITSVTELDDAIHLIDRVYYELLEEGVDMVKPPIGVMIEVPSAVYQVHELAKRVDFISVGSNDLIQYLLAVDRNNPRVADLYDCLHPAVIRSLKQVVDATKELNIPVSICGEMASDPAAVILLIGLGFNALSMNASNLLRIKWVVNNIHFEYAHQLLMEVLEIENPAIIRLRLEQALSDAGLGGLVRISKR